MGQIIDRIEFTPDDRESFAQRLTQCLRALEQMLEVPEFGVGPASLGTELELSLIDHEARPLACNREVIAESGDERLTVELDRFNLECNLRYGPLAGRPFEALGDEFSSALAEVRGAAEIHAGRPVMVGILPTLQPRDLGPAAMTETPRFRALSTALSRRRAAPFRLDIDGADPLQLDCHDVTFEGAATSFQIHMRVEPGDFNRIYNAAQLATAPVLAVAGNSPLFLGHALWEETRIALFKQAVDDRTASARGKNQEARVSFGTHWIEGGALELFTSAVRDYDPILPMASDQDPLELLTRGQVPGLEELRLHAGTVWRWNRPVYDDAAGGHLRIELRALPAGPSVVDMLANAAFFVGLTLGLARDIEDHTSSLDFEAAHHNFYRAAQQGLAAELAWPGAGGAAPRVRSAAEWLDELLPVAGDGLEAAGVARSDWQPLLEVVAKRGRSGRTGARWQRAMLAALEASHGRDEALRRTLEAYVARSDENAPVHTWSLEEA